MDSIQTVSWIEDLEKFGMFHMYVNRNYKITDSEKYNAVYYSHGKDFAFGHLANEEEKAMIGLLKSLKEELWRRCNT